MKLSLSSRLSRLLGKKRNWNGPARPKYPNRKSRGRSQSLPESSYERMTVLSASTPFPIGQRALRPVAKGFDLQTPLSSADAEARRLTAAVARGDEAAFRQLYDRYRERLFRFALVLGRGDESLAHETVQSVFVTAAAKLRRTESEAHLWNWLALV